MEQSGRSIVSVWRHRGRWPRPPAIRPCRTQMPDTPRKARRSCGRRREWRPAYAQSSCYLARNPTLESGRGNLFPPAPTRSIRPTHGLPAYRRRKSPTGDACPLPSLPVDRSLVGPGVPPPDCASSIHAVTLTLPHDRSSQARGYCAREQGYCALDCPRHPAPDLGHQLLAHAGCWPVEVRVLAPVTTTPGNGRRSATYSDTASAPTCGKPTQPRWHQTKPACIVRRRSTIQFLNETAGQRSNSNKSN